MAIAVLALVGTLYTARTSRMAGREQVAQQAQPTERALDREAFKEIRESLQSQIDGLREEIGQLKHDVNKLSEDVADREARLRSAMVLIREGNRRLTGAGLDPVTIPPELIMWSI
ncbi:hypothetical protein ACIPW9_36040 [Streptomyces sp. NPDC090052]|uniref:hypothetical protein n=1 Tax=Streptomyces sp. NPDC090052 TaxID=3365931 RepID=UPI0037F26281